MKHLMLFPVLVLAAACAQSDPAGPTAGTPLFAASANGAQEIRVMTHNVYPGANMDDLQGALTTPSPDDDLPALVAGYHTLVRTDWPTRAGAFADQIAAHRPHVVALQEIAAFDIDLKALYQLGYLDEEIDYEIDFLPILLNELDQRGLDYDVVSVLNIDLDVAPIPGVTTVHYRDWDVLLVRSDLEPTAVGGMTFTACVGPAPCLGGAPVTIKRGFVYATVPLLGANITFVGTHPESGTDVGPSYVRALQVNELLEWLGATSPVILMGDLNEEPNVDLVPGVPGVHEMLAGSGFTDVWRSLRPGVGGFTCCHPGDLSFGGPLALDERIDFVMERGLSRPGPGLQGSMRILNHLPSSVLRVPDGLIWPSDHAGLSAGLLFPGGLH